MKYYTFVAENTNKKKNWLQRLFGAKDKPSNAILFGADEFRGNEQPNKGVFVNVLESSHREVRAVSQSIPFLISVFKYITKTEDQMMYYPWRISKTDTDKITSSCSFRPVIHLSELQKDKTFITAYEKEQFVLHGRTKISIPLLPEEKVVVLFKVEPFEVK